MEIVGHHGFGDRAVAFNQLGAEINVENVFAVVHFGEGLVDLEDFAALDAEGLAARENGQQDDFRAGLADADLAHDGGHALKDVGLAVVLGVVGADHHDGGFGLDAVELAVLKTPEDVLGVVAADAHVDGLAGAVELLPDIFAVPLPAFGDGVADELDVVVAGGGLGALEDQVLAVGGVARARDGNDGVVGVNDDRVGRSLRRCGGRIGLGGGEKRQQRNRRGQGKEFDCGFHGERMTAAGGLVNALMRRAQGGGVQRALTC